MKLAKTIIIVALSVMLALSVSLNIFIFTIFEIKDVDSFKQALLCRELFESLSQLGDTDTDYSDDITVDTDAPSTEIKVPEAEVPEEAKVIYDENGVKISLVSQELTLFGPALEFFVENNADQTLDIYLTDIYIDGIQAEFTGMYCSELAAGRKAYETLHLDGCETFPSVVEFVVQIQDPDTWYTIVETEPLYLCLN